ncbi:MAG: DUF2071 domain-containing protein [Chloroflexota bacterium]|jgi:uncharacterized protein
MTTHPDARTHPAFNQTGHRPWPLPDGRWSWRQSWRDLLFAHWPVPVAALRPLVPAGLAVQEFDGTSWVGVVPFRMAGVMRRPWPDLPWVSAFPELNVRLYVEVGGKPGVWFLSLDATNRLAVAAARRLFYLPYYRAQIDIKSKGEGFAYRSIRSERRRGTGWGVFDAIYRPVAPVYQSTPDTLEHFLTERYCLYALGPDGALYRTEVHHMPWPLQQATAEVRANTMLRPHGLFIEETSPVVLHFTRRIDVVVWQPERLPVSE